MSAAQLSAAVQRRAALMVLQSAQAMLFQAASGSLLLVLLGIVAMGFLLLGGASDFLPELPAIDAFSPFGIAVLVVWLASALAVPVWYVWTLRIATRAARHSAAGEIYPYPFVGQLVWDEAPRIWKWMVIEPAGSDGPGADTGDVAESDVESDR